VRKHTPLGKVYLTLNTADGLPFELFAQLGRAGSDVAAFTEGIARLVSLALRCGVDPQEVADELAGIGGQRSVGFGPNRVKSVPDAISQFLGEYLDGKVDVSALAASRSGQLLLFGDGSEARGEAGEPDSGSGETDGEGVGEDGTGYSYPGGPGRASSDSSGEVLRARRGLDLCPVCGMHGLAYEEGCLKCRSCGYSEC
jgi:ribonucleoside-diphosphate reductase alpha chain